MKGLDGLIRLYRWRVDEKRRYLVGLESQAAEIGLRARALEAEVGDEQAAARASAVAGRAYGAYALSVIDRRGKLADSAAEVAERIDAARRELAVSFRALKRVELVAAGNARRAEAAAARRHQGMLDELSLNMHRRAERPA